MTCNNIKKLYLEHMGTSKIRDNLERRVHANFSNIIRFTYNVI
ncbi:unnamed protein product [Callosobruchus maculatus]|uniref:Uncharacterized protein n=1 Tax=Callosobruchus maculatus TaxID=64391 RepID=A0A653C5Y4_CALMS|nr:unnamed protein product [Callosobruchus maculatus]